VSVLGMTEINALNNPPRKRDFHQVTVVDSSNVTLNDVNSSEFPAYQGPSGYLQYLTPVPLSGYTAKMSIKDQIDGTELLRLDTTGGAAGHIVIDTTALTITLTVPATATAAVAWPNGVYDLEMVDAGGVVTTLLAGAVSVVKDITTT
jgi:hypothetical protein